MRRRPVSSALIVVLLLLPAQAAPHGAPGGEAAEHAAGDARRVLELDLPRALALAMEQNPELVALAADAAAASAQRDRSAAERWPAIRAVGGATGYRRAQRLYPAAAPGEPAIVSHQIAGADAVVSVPLFTGGRLSEAVRAAEASAESVEHARERARAEVVFGVTALYFEVLAQREVVRALLASETGLEEHLRRLDALVAERKAAPIDRLRIDVRLSATRQRRVQDEAALDVSAFRLAAAVGVDGSATSIAVVGYLDRSPHVPRLDEAATIDHALAQRVDRAAFLAKVRAQEARVASARGGHWGQLSLLGAFGVRWGISPSEAPPGLAHAADVGQIGLVYDVPLFLGGRIRAEVREQEARLEADRARLRALELRIVSEVEAAMRGVRAAIARLAPAEKSAEQAREAFRIETEKHAAGKSTVSDVLSAQADLIDAEASRAGVLADVHVAMAELRLAAGDAP